MDMHFIHRLIGKPDSKWSDLFLVFLLVTSIVGFLTIKKWTNICLFLILILSFFYTKRIFIDLYKKDMLKRAMPIIIIFSLPIIAIFIGQLGRGDWLFRAFDGPSRIFLSIPILFLFMYKKINCSYLIGVVAPITMVVTLYSILIDPERISNGGGRYSTTFVDPNTLGTYSLLFTSFCLINMDLNYKSPKLWYIYQFIGTLAGFFIIIGTGTRGSWLAIPFILSLWVIFNYRKINKQFFLILISFVFLSSMTVFYYFPYSLDRISDFYSVLGNWDDFEKLDVSVHLRIYMWETAWQLFLQNPLFGYGDHNLAPFLDDFLARQNALSMDITLNKHGPHNQILANALRSGIWGVISVLGLFVVPVIMFIRNINHNIESVARAAKLGVIYITCLFICSLSLEVFSLKYSFSFYGLLISGLIAQILSYQNDSAPFST